MKTVFCLLLLAVVTSPALAQQPLRYTIWADGVLNAQLPKSNLYGLGGGLRAEVSKTVRHASNELFAQLGFTHFLGNEAVTADIGLVNAGYRYQSRHGFNASLGVGMQYWNERLKIHFPDNTITETLVSFIPSATVGLGWRVSTRYRIGLENRILVKPEGSRLSLRDNIAISIGYTF